VESPAPIRVGIVGVGAVAAHHAEVLRREPDVRLAALWDVDPARLAARSAAWGVPAAADLEDLWPRVDAVFVCTPPGHHREPTVRAAAAGKHVFCEKPIALDLADADAMIGACERAGVLLQVGTNFHFHPAYRTMWRLYHSGELGELATCWMRRLQYYPTAGWEARRAQDHWRLRAEDSGGRLFEQIHLVNWLRWIGGPVRRVYGRALTVAEGIAVDDCDLAVLEFARGYGVAELALTATTVEEESTGILGTRGGVACRGDVVRRRLKDGPEEEVPVLPTPSRQRHFLDCVRQGRRPETDGADGRLDLAVCLAFARSAREGRPVALEELALDGGQGR
jgi:UDP-N-acetyl-2-amino-2-deoxyglucuronate dehydrogenase